VAAATKGRSCLASESPASAGIQFWVSSKVTRAKLLVGGVELFGAALSDIRWSSAAQLAEERFGGEIPIHAGIKFGLSFPSKSNPLKV
jgi:hypothetical protein